MNATLIDMRFVKPMDEEIIEQKSKNHDLIVTIEENSIMGGAGSAVNEVLAKKNITKKLLIIGMPDQFVEHGTQEEVQKACGLDALSIESKIVNALSK